jgi:hypothetical protein
MTKMVIKPKKFQSLLWVALPPWMKAPIHKFIRPSKYGPIDFKFSQKEYVVVNIHTVRSQEKKKRKERLHNKQILTICLLCIHIDF